MNVFDELKKTIYKTYGNNPGKLLVHTGSIGWILSSLAQISAISFNNKLSRKDKDFLIPQEITDGVVNVSLFYTLTAGCKKFSDILFESGKLIVPGTKEEITKALKKNNINLKTLNEFNVPISQLIKDKEVLKKFKSTKNGAAVVASIIGSVISSNVLTPIIRNKVGAFVQKKLSEKRTNIKKTEVKTINLDKNVKQEELNTFNKSKNNSPYSNFTRVGGMKI